MEIQVFLNVDPWGILKKFVVLIFVGDLSLHLLFGPWDYVVLNV
jgi:hypothetical protein